MAEGISLKGIVGPDGTVHKINYEYLDNPPSIPNVDADLDTAGDAADAKAAGDAVSKVGGDLSDITKTENLSFLAEENHHRILDNTLTLQPNNYVSCTGFIKVPDDAYAVEVATRTLSSSGTQQDIAPQCFFFDDEKAYISRITDHNNDIATFDIPEGTRYIRVNQPANDVDKTKHIRFVKYTAEVIKSAIDTSATLEADNSLLRNRGTLGTTEDMDALDHGGVYFYRSGQAPANAPINVLSRPLVVKSPTETNHQGEAQLVIQDGVLYFRSMAGAGTSWTNWKSYGLGSPMYQTETLPYNAVLYHAKWDSLLQDRVLRRINLGAVDNDSSLPMYAYEFCPQRDFVGVSGNGSVGRDFDWTNALYPRKKILVLGGVHGNEKCTPMDIYAIAKALLNRDYNDVACKFDWYFIPLINPWGYSHARLDEDGEIIYGNTGEEASIVPCSETINAGIRNNAHGQNINRDWSDVIYTADGVSYGFQTPELQLIKDYIFSINPDVVIDTHQNHANRTVQTNPICCHAGAPIDSTKAGTDADYAELMHKIYSRIDIANADTDKTMLRYANSVSQPYQACRVWPTISAATAAHYFAGVTATSGSTVIGNTQHSEYATPFAFATETSEICANYSGTTDWYTPIACTFSCTYLWNILKQIAEMH